MPSKISNKRHVAFNKQSGRCYYLEIHIWLHYMHNATANRYPE